ncbi:TetR/AcrR family transcriptional regulator [Nocardioides iriomotensis]|uniref:TetR/AcrR family transcriptional regulator n=1 Tax=Nocardioides iriomotensis TaxID=715784 RepID=A0A4Q5J768_9ACTN|nr:TetR/AcrR family transcriptional regulator [Nocardioides iriomotensis]RYU14490.1 TetR/AcrR family transcriptional regulator [Nocardioides iriomotensis]
MARETSRREELAQAATDYVLQHGLIGLSLRPLAAAIGTSDRMVLYHFDDKDDLVATVLRVSNDRSVAAIRALPPARDVREAVLQLWQTVTRPELVGCQRMYVEAAALGLFGREPYAGVVGAANDVWMSAVADHLVASGASRRRAARATTLLDSAFSGFLLDSPFGDGEGDGEADTTKRQAVRDLADAVAVVAGQGSA